MDGNRVTWSVKWRLVFLVAGILTIAGGVLWLTVGGIAHQWALERSLRIHVSRATIPDTGLSNDCGCLLQSSLIYDRQRVPFLLRWASPSSVCVRESSLPWPLFGAGDLRISRLGERNAEYEISMPLVQRKGDRLLKLNAGERSSGQILVGVEPPLDEEVYLVEGYAYVTVCPVGPARGGAPVLGQRVRVEVSGTVNAQRQLLAREEQRNKPQADAEPGKGPGK